MSHPEELGFWYHFGYDQQYQYNSGQDELFDCHPSIVMAMDLGLRLCLERHLDLKLGSDLDFESVF